MKKLLPLLALLATLNLYSQTSTPEIYSWRLNNTGYTGYNGIKADVQKVQYSSNYVYISSTGIPEYTIGPWKGNPSTPADQKYIFRIPRNPIIDSSGNNRHVGLGPIGFYINGVPLFSALDAMSYNNAGIWHQNAVVVEASSFDSCLGHPAPGMGPNGNSNGSYHHHQNPHCLYTADSTSHSPIVGYAFDGFPVYGPYAYKNKDGSGGIMRMRSGYHLRNITDRSTLPDGTKLSSAKYGPAISAKALGYYAEDFAYDSANASLDAHNGRYAKTPEYPNGIYAYFVTVNSDGSSAFPYAIGTKYAGIADTANIGPGGGHLTIKESVTTYTSIESEEDLKGYAIYPNPSSSVVNIHFKTNLSTSVDFTLYNAMGKQAAKQKIPSGSSDFQVYISDLPAGMYFIRFLSGNKLQTEKIIINR